jgi:acetyl-CoA C-acetyltransferase
VLGVAATSYALLDDSLRRHREQTIDEHRTAIAELWAGFSEVAAANPYAWDRVPRSASEIREPSARNRMISFPYTKALVANNTVDLASAVLLCSAETAAQLGVAADRLVYPHVSTSSHETWQIINRRQLHETPALATAGRLALDHVGITPADLRHVDLYACFPAIVRMSCESLAIPATPSPTITGGLGFAGAPVANSSGQAIAALVPLLRDGGWGFVHANGGNATKHGFGIYSSTPSEQFARIDAQPQVELAPRAAAPADWLGDGPVESMTVVYDREGPTHLIAAQLNADGERALVRSTDRDLIDQAQVDGLDDFSGRLPGVERLA